MKELEETIFNENKYYKEIVKEFINKFNSKRINVQEDNIIVEANDKAGSRIIYFTLDESKNLVIKVDRTINNLKYQDIIIYNTEGIMLERVTAQAEIKNNIPQDIRDNSSILEKEFENIGQNKSIYTNKIFKRIDLKKVNRNDIQEIFTHKKIEYDQEGLMNGRLIEGTFKISSDNIKVLEFPNESDIVVTKDEVINDDNVYMYPNSRTL